MDTNNLKRTTEVFLLRGNEILLGHKKRGMGTGKVLGIGGHVEEGETVRETAVREIYEEILVAVPPGSLQPIAIMDYIFPHKPHWSLQAHFFITAEWEGEPQETAEIRPEFFPIASLPFELMWADTPFWLPQALQQARCFRGHFIHGADNDSIASYELEIVG